MKTDLFLQTFSSQPHVLQKQAECAYNNVSLWIHEHPTTMKVIEVAGSVLGAAMFISAPFSFAAIGIVAAIGLGISGFLVLGVSVVAYKVLDLIISPHHDMATHVFKTGECEGGRLFYQGDVPILSIEADDPVVAGKAHGYLLGESLNHLFKRVDFTLHTLARLPRASEAQQGIQEIKKTIPREYLLEMEGVVQGYQQWARENPLSFPKTITLDDLILLHLMPDHHNLPKTADSELMAHEWNPLEQVACSVILDKDENNEIVFGRNMDWPSFGMAGAHSLVIHRKHKETGITTAEIGIPGFVGTITGMNREGLALSMNVCGSAPVSEVKGMPAVFFNRYCLEHGKSVREVEELTRRIKPLGAYHMSVAEAQEARAFHFYQSYNQSEGDTTVQRRVHPGKPLIVLNCQYPTPDSSTAPMHCSEERERMLSSFFDAAATQIPSSQRKTAKLVAHGLSLPYVNNSLTTHKVLMQPGSRKMSLCFDNAFAGKGTLHPVNMDELFE